MKMFNKKSFFLMGILIFIISLCGLLETQGSLKKEIFEKRREKLMDRMEEGIAVIRGAGNISDFYYLTGLHDEDAVIFLIPEADEKYILFIRPSSPVRELWSGKHPGLEEAKTVFGADEAYPIREFDKLLPRYLRGKSKVYVSFRDKELYDKIIPMIRSPQGSEPVKVLDPRSSIHEMRLIKEAEEIRLMKKAAEITCEALIEVMKAVEPGIFEYEAEAIIEYVFRSSGAQGPGFPSIVGSGPNSTILHNDANERQTQDGDLLLMDVGAEYEHYKSDVTRTIPVNGKFSQEQKEIYEIVLQAQKEAIKSAAPGVRIYEINDRGVEVIKEGLYKLGLITDKNSQWQHRAWLMYNISHWVGLDVHDVGGRGPAEEKGWKLKPGMVFTVEPGIYIRKETLENLPSMLGRAKVKKQELEDFIRRVSPSVQKYKNIGIRIEDDVLVTEEGHEVLSAKAPKEVDSIEKLMKKKSYLKKNK